MKLVNYLPHTRGIYHYVFKYVMVIIIGTLLLSPERHIPKFDGERSLKDVYQQVSWGARIPGSNAHKKTCEWIVNTLKRNGWKTEIQVDKYHTMQVYNIVGIRESKGSTILLGAHYDSRPVADHDTNPNNRLYPVPGANDGASGVAVLLELSRILPKNINNTIWLVFFDAEDGGNLEENDWIIGSTLFAKKLVKNPDVVVIIDMVGDADLNIYYELNSDPGISKSIWDQASLLGYRQFKPFPKYRILDDHVPFLSKGIRSVNIIDFDYPYWHTLEDTPDKISAESLTAVGETLLHWILSYKE